MFSIFSEALGHIRQRPMQALKIIALPLIFNVAAELFAAHQFIVSDYSAGGLSSTIVVIVNFMATAIIAVCWHRLVLLEEPAKLVPRQQMLLYFRYFV